MRTEAEIRAELARVEKSLASGRRMQVSAAADLYARADMLRWVLGMEPVL